MPRTNNSDPEYVAFVAGRLLASGSLEAVALAAKLATDAGAPRVVQVMNGRTSEPRDLDLGGTVEQVLARLSTGDHAPASPTQSRSGPGRPRLGVVAREVTLLPRHWAWLSEQSGGASAALRRLVDEARGAHAGRDAHRKALDAVYRFVQATLGDAPGFEEASRALFAGDEARFVAESEAWPADLRAHALTLARAVFEPART